MSSVNVRNLTSNNYSFEVTLLSMQGTHQTIRVALAPGQTKLVVLPSGITWSMLGTCPAVQEELAKTSPNYSITPVAEDDPAGELADMHLVDAFTPGLHAIGAAGTGIAATDAGANHNHGVTVAKLRQQQHFSHVPAPAVNYVAQYAAGAAIDDAVGPFARFVPPRTVMITRGGAGVATSYTIDGTDPDGNALQEIIAAPGAGPYQGTRAFSTITRVRSDVDPTVTTDVQTGNGFGLAVVASDIDVVGVDGGNEAPVSVHAATGTVIPTTVPNAAHHYTVDYRVQPTATSANENVHTHPLTDPTHTHTQPAGAVSGTYYADTTAPRAGTLTRIRMWNEAASAVGETLTLDRLYVDGVEKLVAAGATLQIPASTAARTIVTLDISALDIKVTDGQVIGWRLTLVGGSTLTVTHVEVRVSE